MSNQVACWNCHRTTGTFRNIRLEVTNPKTGKQLKSNDYICTECFNQGLSVPPSWNASSVPTPPDQSGFKDNVAIQENVQVELS